MCSGNQELGKEAAAKVYLKVSNAWPSTLDSIPGQGMIPPPLGR